MNLLSSEMDKQLDTADVSGLTKTHMNPLSIEYHVQNIEKLNVWSGIWNRQIIGPFFIEGNLNWGKYKDLLEERVWPI